LKHNDATFWRGQMRNNSTLSFGKPVPGGSCPEKMQRESIRMENQIQTDQFKNQGDAAVVFGERA
jgi:hypothetical protein